MCTQHLHCTPCIQPSSSHVLTDAVLQMQRGTITALNQVARELREVKNVLSKLNATMKEFINK